MFKRNLIFFIFFISTVLVGFVTDANPETLRCKIAAMNTKVETMPVNDVEGASLRMNTNEGLAFCENGEVANFRAQAISDRKEGQGWRAMGYNSFTFGDGSKIIRKWDLQGTVGSSGKFDVKGTSEIIKGTGRFEGIRGTATSTGIKVPEVKEGPQKDAHDVTITYTLPGK